jgi:hypothetical protein
MLLDLTAGQGHKYGQLTPSTFMHAALFPTIHPNHCWPCMSRGLIAANDRFLPERRPNSQAWGADDPMAQTM